MNNKPSTQRPESDDQIIATAFRRSVQIIGGALLVVTLVSAAWLLYTSLSSVPEDTREADLIAPQQFAPTQQIAVPQIRFTDVTKEAGLHHQHINGAYGERLLPETMGGGVAVLDFNNDGNVDLLFINGRSWPWQPQTSESSSLIMYQGDGKGRFQDVTEELSLQAQLFGMGAAIGDYDGDGDADIFVSTVGGNRLFRNMDGRGFVDATNEAGVAGAADAWSTGAGFLDYDRDGDLDLLVLNYVVWSRDIDLQADYQLTGIGRAYGPPAQFAGTHPYLYRNNGDGTFKEVSEASGLHVVNESTGTPLGKGLAFLPTDVNDDGWVDLVVANDTVRNFLFVNRNGEGFNEVGVERGIAFDNSGIATGAMGIDGVESQAGSKIIAMGNFGNEMTSLYSRPQGTTLFTDQAIVTGVGPASRRVVTFGLLFFDADLDGRVDLLQSNGHVENEINVVEPGQQYAQPPQLFWNCGEHCARQFALLPTEPDNDLANPIVGRGAAYADIDKDGDLDVILTQIGGPPVLLRNDQRSGHNWVQFEITNPEGSPAYGAEVEITGAELSQRARLEPTRSYLSQVEPLLNFGIGERQSIEQATVFWPDGKSRIIEHPAINQRMRVSYPIE
ncbi:MAG: CRTAC1 family protein [Gammaproteobacteria bacterium]|nr:CRTAC1 family protein [Gammaproteobacteria bacterium]